MYRSFLKYFIIFLFLFISSCEEKANDDNSDLETTTEIIPTSEKVEYVLRPDFINTFRMFK